MFLKKKNPIGLDIGSSYIKAVQLNNAKEGDQSSSFISMLLDRELITDGIIT